MIVREPNGPMRSVSEEAYEIAQENYKADSDIVEILWFRDDCEIRLVECHTKVPKDPEGYVRPIHFGPVPREDIWHPSAIALVNKDEFRSAKLPDGWGSWETAKKIAKSDE